MKTGIDAKKKTRSENQIANIKGIGKVWTEFKTIFL